MYSLHYITLSIIFLISFFSCSSSKEEHKEKKESYISLPDTPSLVKAQRIESKDFNQEIVSNGTITASKKVDLKFEQQDLIERIYVQNGQHVSAGQTIASLDKFKFQNTLDQATDNLKKAKLELQDVLIGQGYKLADSLKVPKEVMDLAKVRSNYDNALAQFRLAQHNLKNSTLYAPFSGVVANLFSREHNLPTEGEPFCTIINNSSLNVDFMILESELQTVNLNDKVTITPTSYGDKHAEGSITEINPLVDKNGMVRVQATITQPNGMKLYEGMNTKVHIQHLLAKQLAIPKEALVLRTNKEVVFTLKNGKAHWNYVSIGPENSFEYLVYEGLNEGDTIIYEGNIDLAHETPVKVVE